MRRVALFLLIFAGFSKSLLASFEDLSDLNARGVALAGAILTLGNDGNAVVGNPALLATQPLLTLSFTTHVDGADLAGETLFFGTMQMILPLGKGIGMGTSLSSAIDGLDENGVGKTLFADFQGNLGLGFSIVSNLQIGGSFHLRGLYVNPLFSDLGGYHAPFEINMSVGVFSAPIKYLAVALVASRILPTLGNGGLRTDNRLSPALRAGVGTRNPIFLGEAALEFLILEKTFAFALGIERFFFRNILRVSAGMRISGMEGEFTPGGGIGIRLGKWSVDYAFLYPLSGVLRAGSHIATVSVQL